MTIRIVRLGSRRAKDEGLRLGTVRRPPRGVLKRDYAVRNYYDVWLPILAPSAKTLKLAKTAVTERGWARFMKTFRAEMATPANKAILGVFAALWHQTNFSLGCYCENESHCHRPVLRQLLRKRGAQVR